MEWHKGYRSFDEFFAQYAPYNEYLWSEYRKGHIGKKELSIQRFRHPLEPLGAYDDQEILNINEQFFARTAQKSKVEEGAIQLLEYLHGLYKIVIVSNGFVEVQKQKMQSSGILPYIDHIVLSEEAGANKPSYSIFQYAFNKSQSRPRDVLFIGDSWEADIMGAQVAHIPSIWYNPHHLPRPEGHFKYPIYEVAHLSEIPPLLRSLIPAM